MSESSCVCIQSCRPVAPFFFLVKIPFLTLFFGIESVELYRHVCDIPLVTLIPNIYILVCGFGYLFFLSGKITKISIFLLFFIQKGV